MDNSFDVIRKMLGSAGFKTRGCDAAEVLVADIARYAIRSVGGSIPAPATQTKTSP